RDRRLSLRTWNPRVYSDDRNRRVDDRSFGGGPGMVMQCQPLEDTLTAIRADRPDHDAAPVILLSPRGEPFRQARARTLAQDTSGFILLCGRYEGIDQRFVDAHVDLQLSIGDFVLSGGELPA